MIRFFALWLWLATGHDAQPMSGDAVQYQVDHCQMAGLIPTFLVDGDMDIVAVACAVSDEPVDPGI